METMSIVRGLIIVGVVIFVIAYIYKAAKDEIDKLKKKKEQA